MQDTAQFVKENTTLKTADVREMLGISRPTVFRMIKNGKLPKPFMLNGSYRWQRQVFCDWLKSQ